MEKKGQFEVSKEERARLDCFLTEKLEGSRSQVKNWIANEQVQVNGNAVKAGYMVKAGDVVSFLLPEPKDLDLVPESLPLHIVYEDSDLIVINKQAGMVVHPGAGNQEGTLVHALLAHCKDLSGIGGVKRPGIVHRLDKDTTGLLVVAKNDPTHQILAQQLVDRVVKRQYLALCQGVVKNQEGRIEAPIGRNPKDRKQMAVSLTGRLAITHYKVRECFLRHTLVECSLETGRTHQIRVHLASMHHPIVGDPLYGWEKKSGGAKRQMLHAYALSFVHPKGFPLALTAELPLDFLQSLEWAAKMS